jgi:perosamine synthetase
MLPIYQPYLPASCLKYAHDALDSTWISSQGIYIDKAKEMLKQIVGARYVIMVNNGTCATHMLALGLKFKYPNLRKLIVPNNVYVAAWNSFLFSGGFDFEVIDANEETWNIDHAQITGSGENTALLAVHNLGNIINIPELQRKYPKLIIVEDNCEGLFGKYEGHYTGTSSLISSVSFFGNKTITSGEGGAVFTSDDELFEYLNSVRGQGMSSVRYVHDKLGYNYRMTNVQAALLYGQLEIMSEIRERKAMVFDMYKSELASAEEIVFQVEENGTEHAQWMFAVRFPGFDLNKKRMLELFLFENNIETRPMFYSINSHTHLKNIPSVNTVADRLNHQCLILPSFPELTKSQILTVSRKIKEFLRTSK